MHGDHVQEHPEWLLWVDSVEKVDHQESTERVGLQIRTGLH